MPQIIYRGNDCMTTLQHILSSRLAAVPSRFERRTAKAGQAIPAGEDGLQLRQMLAVPHCHSDPKLLRKRYQESGQCCDADLPPTLVSWDEANPRQCFVRVMTPRDWPDGPTFWNPILRGHGWPDGPTFWNPLLRGHGWLRTGSSIELPG